MKRYSITQREWRDVQAVYAGKVLETLKKRINAGMDFDDIREEIDEMIEQTKQMVRVNAGDELIQRALTSEPQEEDQQLTDKQFKWSLITIAAAAVGAAVGLLSQ